MRNATANIMAVILGAAAGAAAGILLAPQSGKETRRKLAETAGDVGQDLNRTWSSTAEKFKDLTDSIFSETDKYATKVSSAVKEANAQTSRI